MNDPDSTRYDDAALIIKLAKITPGLPFPGVSAIQAVFHFTSIVRAEDARRAVAWAETILSHELGLDFKPRDVPRIGSSDHYVLTAKMPSGLRVDIVAKAGIFDGHDAPAGAREPIGAAA